MFFKVLVHVNGGAQTFLQLCYSCATPAVQVSMAADAEASIALPFTPRPQMLTGELVGDVGFDPLNFSEEVSNTFLLSSACVKGVTSKYTICC